MAYRDDINKVVLQGLPWGIIQGCNILVTGATGLVGSCFVDLLMAYPQKEYNVFASGRNLERAKKRFSRYWRDAHFHFIQMDILNPLECDIYFDYIVHAASNASPSFFVYQPVEVMKSNLLGLSHLMDYGLSHRLKRFLFVSTGEIYGEGDGRAFDECYSGYVNSMNVRSCYPSSKRAAETLCVSYAAEYGVEVVVARLSHTYGPYYTESDNRVYAQFFSNVMQGRDIVLKSSGEQYRSWCYVVDSVSALLFILLKGENQNAYNVADENSNVTIRFLAESIASLAQKNVIFENADTVEANGYNPVKKSIFVTDKVRSLGWQPLFSLQEGLTSTLNELKSV